MSFTGWPCFQEPVGRGLKVSICPPALSIRCAHTGDLLCDTPADPKMDDNGIYTGDPTCTWNANGLTDSYGDTYQPNPNNYMGYANSEDNCRTDFSFGQKKWMFVWAFNFIGTAPYKGAVARGWLPSNNDQFDIYEPDNEAIAARLIEPGQIQNHTFHKKGREDVDWLVFTVPSCGLTKDVSFIVTDLTSNAVDEVAFFERDVNSNAGAELTATENNGTFTLAAGNLLPGLEYLVRITKDTDNSEYSVKYLFTNSCVFGPSVVCNTNTTFSISQRPAGSTITLDRSPNLTYVSGQGTNSFVVKTTALQAAAWVQPKITISGTQYSLPKKHVWAGPPLQAHNSDIYAVGYQDQNPITLADNALYTFRIEPLSGATSYSWNMPAGFSLQTPTTSSEAKIWTSSQNGTYSLKVYPSNQCGNSGTGFTSLTINITSGSGGGGDPNCPNPPCSIPHPNIVINPNPTSDEAVISFEDIESAERYFAERNFKTMQVSISNLSGDIVYHGALNKNGLSVNLRKQKRGIYILKIYHKDFEESFKLILQ